MKIRIIDNVSYQTFPTTDDMIDVDEKELALIGKTKQFDTYRKTIIDYINPSSIETIEIIKEKQARLTELTKDLAQVQAGLIIPNIEEKKEEFRTLLNEIRVLQGKEPRIINT